MTNIRRTTLTTSLVILMTALCCRTATSQEKDFNAYVFVVDLVNHDSIDNVAYR